jgi:hypothetical protein
MTVMNQTLPDLVLQTIREKKLRPTELIRELVRVGYPREIENALSGLIENGSVVFGSDGILRVTETLPRAS